MQIKDELWLQFHVPAHMESYQHGSWRSRCQNRRRSYLNCPRIPLMRSAQMQEEAKEEEDVSAPLPSLPTDQGQPSSGARSGIHLPSQARALPSAGFFQTASKSGFASLLLSGSSFFSSGTACRSIPSYQQPINVVTNEYDLSSVSLTTPSCLSLSLSLSLSLFLSHQPFFTQQPLRNCRPRPHGIVVPPATAFSSRSKLSRRELTRVLMGDVFLGVVEGGGDMVRYQGWKSMSL